MGYKMRQMDSSFVIPQDLLEESLSSLKRNVTNNRDFWNEIVDVEGVNRADTLHNALLYFNWKVYYSDDGNVNGILFVGETYRDDKALFEILAPYAYSGSWIIMKGEDDALWRWLIDSNGRCKEQSGKIVFE
jgi:hypothetical protein